MDSRRYSCVLAVLGGLIASGRGEAGINYQDPAGGWRYTYQGTFNAPVADSECLGATCPAGFGDHKQELALDGSWLHSQSDKWDGSGLGNYSVPNNNPTGTSPGGAESLTDGGTNFIRLQDTGNPESFGYVQVSPRPINSNRRIYFGRPMSIDGEPQPVNGLNGNRVLDNGITISFRMRIPNAGTFDPVFPATGAPTQNWFVPPEADYSNSGGVDAADYVTWRKGVQPLANEVATPLGTTDPADYTAWRARFGNQQLGRGYPIHDDGRGMITILQYNLDESDPFYGQNGTIAFSMLTSKDIKALNDAGATVFPVGQSGGLVMNNRSGDLPNKSVDYTDVGQTLNLLPIADQALKDWHEFWITIVSNGAAAGTHRVNVYMDGATTPVSFDVTMSDSGNGAYTCAGCLKSAYQEFGMSSSGLSGSFDMDFYSYQLGVITPVAAGAGLNDLSVPEPSAFILILLTAFGACVPRHSRYKAI